VQHAAAQLAHGNDCEIEILSSAFNRAAGARSETAALAVSASPRCDHDVAREPRRWKVVRLIVKSEAHLV
jgi:hypothetical protein